MASVGTRWLSFTSGVDASSRLDVGSPRSRSTLLVALAGVASLGTVLVYVGLMAWHRTQLDLSVYVLGAHHITDSQLYFVRLAHPPHLPFTYPPFAALIFWPLSLVPLQIAQLLWAAVNVFALWAIIALSLRVVRSKWESTARLAWSMVLLAPALALEPVSLTLSFGQVNLVLAALVLADLTGQVRVGRWTLPRGVMIGVAAAVKLVPLVFIPYLLLTRQRKAAGVAAAAFVSSSLLAAAFDPRVSWSFWTKYVVDAQRIGGVSYVSNQSLRGSLDRLTHHLLSAQAATGLAALVVVAGLALAWWAGHASSPFLGVLVCATTGMLASPITWAHHMVWVVPVLIWLVWGHDRPKGGWVWAVLSWALFWWDPIWVVPTGGMSEHGWQLARGNAFFGAMVLFMVAITLMLSTRRIRAHHATYGQPTVR